MARRRPKDRGAVLVEFALILPVLVLLLFGIAEYGIAFNNLNSLRQGTREGARQAVVATVDTDSSCTLTGISPNTETRRLLCLIKDRIGLDPAKLRLKIEFPTANEEGESVLVCSQYPLNSVTGLFSSLLGGRIQTTEVLMRIESKDEDFQETAETPVASNNWSFCG